MKKLFFLSILLAFQARCYGIPSRKTGSIFLFILLNKSVWNIWNLVSISCPKHNFLWNTTSILCSTLSSVNTCLISLFSNFQTTHRTRVSGGQSGRLCKHHLRGFGWQYCFNRLVRSGPSGKDGLRRRSHSKFCYGATSQIFATGASVISSSL